MPDLDYDEIRTWIRKIILIEKYKPGDLNFIFCSDKYIQSLNEKYLNHHYPTDVLSFDYCVNQQIAGDIFIGVETVILNCKELNTILLQEFKRVIAHGILHLIGYDDKTKEDECLIRSKEDYYLSLRVTK